MPAGSHVMSSNKNIRAGIIGAAGYTGGELTRLLLRHPGVRLAFAHSRSNAGKPIASVHADLYGDTEMTFTSDLSNDIDVLFLCLGHGESRKFLSENHINEEVRIIDLANDFRLKDSAKLGNRHFIYGLPELNRETIRNAHDISNPGCFATTIQLALLPLAKSGLLKDVYTTGITGSTGAGQSLTATSQFSWRSNNIQAYKTLTHQHLGEVEQSLHQIRAGNRINVNFVPWRGDFTRGIFVTSQIHCEEEPAALQEMFTDYYKDHPFVHITREQVFLKQVVNTNKCIIQLEKVGSILAVHSAADNLLKGACGQAVQNMNLMFGIDETCGLDLKASYF
jgi:N-acetyl-gamma-glutamyl-phosphate reductase